MKSSTELSNRLRRGFLGAAALTAALLLGSQAYAQSSPEGSWDCVINGNGQKGLAVINFTTSTDSSGRFIFTGYQILTQSPKPNQDTAASRGTIGDGRPSGGETSDTNSASTTNIVVFGFFSDISGTWSYDNNGKVVGSFFAPIVSGDDTNVSSFAVSFVGKVVPGKHLTLTASSSTGKFVYQGKPFVDLGDFSGPWIGRKFVGEQTFLEFFNLTLILPNLYQMVGAGPDYAYGSSGSDVCMISRQGKIAFSLFEVPAIGSNAVLRATMGPFTNNKNTTSGKTTGIQHPLTPIRFNAGLQQFLP